MDIQIVKTGVQHPDFIQLVSELDHYYFMQFREIVLNYQEHHDPSTMKCGVVAYVDGEPAGCGAFKEYRPGTAEMKRIFVRNKFRRHGLASRIMERLEETAAREGYHQFVLETGVEMKDAILFYQKTGYQVVPNFGSFEGDDVCICFAKSLQPQTE